MKYKLWDTIRGTLTDGRWIIEWEIVWIEEMKKWKDIRYSINDWTYVHQFYLSDFETMWKEVTIKVKWKTVEEWYVVDSSVPETLQSDVADTLVGESDTGLSKNDIEWSDLEWLEKIETVLQKAMDVLQQQEQQQQGEQQWQSEQQEQQPQEQSSGWEGWENNDTRKVYVFSIPWWWMHYPIVADNVKQAFDFIGEWSLWWLVYSEQYTAPVPSQWSNHDWLTTPFYY